MKYFGTDGFRGRAGEGLRVEHALKIGQFLGWHYRKVLGRPARCVIGKDTRVSSYMFEYGLAAGVTSAGSDAYLMHVTTSPSISYITKVDQFDFGIMVTASHNPYHDNGIKVFNKAGEKMDEDVLARIERYIDGELKIEQCTEVGVCKDYLIGRNKYIGYLASIPKESLRGYKIVLDCANGASSMIAKNVFEMLGADLVVTGAAPNGRNINVDCGSTHIEALQQAVKANSADIGFAFDGDADRCIVVNERGEVIDGDGIMYILACRLKDRGSLVKDRIAITVMSNIGLVNALAERGISVVTTDVGDKYISRALAEEGLSVGGEQSGHVIFRKYAHTGDGILTALLIADVMAERKCPASSLTLGLTIYPQKLLNIQVADKDAIMSDPRVAAYTDEVNSKLTGKGRLLLRKSGTEPLIRIMSEARSEDECDAIIEDARKFIESV